MTNGEKHIEKLLSWYKEAVTEDGVCYLTSDDKNALAYALKCCKHYEDIKKDIDSWMLREEPSSSEIPNKSENPTSSDDCISRQDVLSEIIRFSTEEGASVECQQLYCDVNNMPSVTPIRPKGHWIYDKSIANWRCSKCGETPKTIAYVGTGSFMAEHFKYCNHCGAKMEEVEE